MNAGEHLDHLIEQHIAGEPQFSPIDEQVAPLLVVAQMVVQLQEIDIPPEFAHRVEMSLRTRASSHNLTQSDAP